MDLLSDRIEWKTEGRPEVTRMTLRCGISSLSMLRCSHRASDDVQHTFQACVRQAAKALTRLGVSVHVDGSDRPPQDLRSYHQHASGSHRRPSFRHRRSGLHLARRCTRRREDDLRLSRKASAPRAAASLVASTYPRQAPAGWRARCGHAEVMFPV